MYETGLLQKHQLRNLMLVVVGGIAITVLILIQVQPSLLNRPTVCEMKQPQASITSRQAMKLLTLKQGSKRQDVLAFMKEPYCQLKEVEVRANTKAQRDVYPLDSDPSICVVLMYEEDQYLGYRFTTKLKAQ